MPAYSEREEEYNQTVTFEEALASNKYLLYTAVGHSMMPLLRPCKDIIEIKPLDTPPQKYSIYLYKRNGQYILHRCLSSDPYIFAGDHNTFKEYDVNDDMILGVMTRVIRDGKSIYPDNWKYKLYSHLWVDFYSARVFILKKKSKVRYAVHKLNSLVKRTRA